MTIHVGAKNQVTLPKDIVKKANLEPGDPLEIVYENDVIVLRPRVEVPRDQAYFWTKEWQAREREAQDHIAAGQVHGPFGSAAEMKRGLRRPRR